MLFKDELYYVIGNLGDGKATLISYFLTAKLDITVNAIRVVL